MLFFLKAEAMELEIMVCVEEHTGKYKYYNIQIN